MAMVNIEAIYQVSFVDQLYTTYLEITSNTETSRRDAIQGDKIEGLVAEHGQVFAMLLSKFALPKVDRVPPRSKVKGKQPHTRKIRRFQSSEFSLMIGEKHSRDFLLTGQTLLRQGKRKEAVAFFQQAVKYSAAYQLTQGYPNGWMARLYNTILKIRLERHGFGSYNDLSNYLEELVEVTERRSANDISEDAPVVTTDCDLTLKLVLTFLIMLSVELDAIEITFAAYDLYSKLFQDNESKFFFLNDQVQVYASRILMTCNGKTASQDILLVSAVSLNDNEADRSKTDKQLFRSVASRRNVPTNGFLITLMSSTFRDIGELQELEREISLSLHECFRLKCFGSGADSTTRVIVDLTSKANTTNPMMRCNRISLLSLCLSDELLTETHHEGNLCQISSTACQKITRSTFQDEQTTKFMYSQTVLGVLENYRSKICSLSVQGQCLRLTIREPVKACLVLQNHGRCIQQVFQLVKTTSREESSVRGPPGHMYREEEDIANEIDEFSMADMHMNLLAKQYQVPCQTNVLYYHDPLDNTGSSVKADDYIPECLSGVTEISKQLKQFCRLRRDEFEGDHYAMVVDANDPEDCSSDLKCSQLHDGLFERDFQSATFPPKRDIRSQSLTLSDPESPGQWEQEEALTSEAECDENILGRVIFQKARHSRRIRLAELHHHLKKTEVSESSLVIEQKRFPLILKGKDDYVTKDQITTETRQMNNPLQSSTYSQQGSSRNENQHSSPTSEITSETSSLADKKVTTCSCELNASTLVPVSGSGRFIIEQDEKSNSALFINLQDQTDREIHINCSMKDKNCTSKRKHEDFESLRNPTNDSQGTDTTENNDRIVRCIPVTKKTDSKWGNGAKARGKDHEEISKIAPAKEKTFSPDVIGVESTTERAADTSNLRISATEKGENHENHVESKIDFDKKVDRKEDEKCISTMCSSKDFDEDRKATQGRVNFENRSSQIGIRTMRGSESGSLTTDKHQGPADHSETDINSSTTTKSFGGARPKILPKGTRKDRFVRFGANDSSLCYRKNKTSRTGLDAGFIARHADDKDRLSFLLPGYENKDALKVPGNHVYDGLCTSSSVCGKWLNREYLPSDKRFLHCNYDAADLRPFPAKDTFEDRGGVQNISRSLVSHEENVPDERKGGKFLRAVTNGNCSLLKSHKEEGLENLTQTKQFEDSTDCSILAMFTGCGSRDARDDMETIANEYSREMETSDCIPVYPETVSKDLPHTEKLSTLLGSFQQTLTKTIRLVASTNANVHRPDRELQSVEKIGIQEETTRSTEREPVIAAGVDEPRRRRESIQATNPTLLAEPKPIATPVQESPRAVCSHYQRRCLVSFPCCGKFYPCHRCHNESDCSEDQARAINATHIRCAICSHEQEIDETSQKCGSCKATMSEYFCVTCKHFTSVDKNPFHCEKCGICRIHRDRSFHCDVCNVCLDKRLEGKHKCRPDSGHEECCICLEDAFSGCQILPCSHKVHKDCAIAMIQNGVRTCPICRHPLFGQLQNNSQ
ncbi:uncharacterized protein LOC111323546 isoform X1 [Stylophora pistillata]|uniref:uncharacterized protein LOC111323546 isoform X1 n=1 Tax=Stylophora pistillata TaxID=50429 RepID=UPI000C04466D|nr:uncharacterized protein LOC111323546 isoform X1 [Stylophora pistillata]